MSNEIKELEAKLKVLKARRTLARIHDASDRFDKWLGTWDWRMFMGFTMGTGFALFIRHMGDFSARPWAITFLFEAMIFPFVVFGLCRK